MILNITNLERPVDTDLSDITASKVIGEASWVSGGLDIPFDVDPSPAEVERIIIRLTTANANEESITLKAKAAITNNTNWQANSYPQLISGADAIVNSTTTNATEKNLARAVKTLSNQVSDLCSQNDALIRLTLELFDATN